MENDAGEVTGVDCRCRTIAGLDWSPVSFLKMVQYEVEEEEETWSSESSSEEEDAVEDDAMPVDDTAVVPAPVDDTADSDEGDDTSSSSSSEEEEEITYPNSTCIPAAQKWYKGWRCSYRTIVAEIPNRAQMRKTLLNKYSKVDYKNVKKRPEDPC